MHFRPPTGDVINDVLYKVIIITLNVICFKQMEKITKHFLRGI